MYECERINQELTEYYSFALSILHFLEKDLTQFQKALNTYSNFLQHLHTKSVNLLTKFHFKGEFSSEFHHAFASFIQTFDDERYQLDQRARFLQLIQIIIRKLKQQINSSKISKQKSQLHHYTSHLIRLFRQKKRQDLSKLVQQIQKHDQLTLTWKNDLDHITLEITNLLWKLFSYSPYKFQIQPIERSSSSLSIIQVTDHKQISELGSGDQLQLESIKEKTEQEQQISNSNNALINSKQNRKENRSIDSTDIDETIVEKNRLYNDLMDNEDDQWIDLVKQNENYWKHPTKTLSISSKQSSDDTESLLKQHQRKNSLHLSDISYTTDYYSQSESD